MSHIRISGWDGRNESITISGINKKEQDMVESALGNCSWIMANEDGRLMSTPKYLPLPDPIEDEKMHPFWSLPTDEKPNTQIRCENNCPEIPNGSSPQILISSLCGYNYSPERYKIEATRLESYGFECMRSRRDSRGKFIEHWYLFGYWAAKGELDAFIKKIKQGAPEKSKLDEVINFICHRVQFGSLEVANQRAAMVIDD